MASTLACFVFAVRLLAWTIAAASVNFPSGFLPLEPCPPPVLALFLFGREDYSITAVLLPTSCTAVAASLFFRRGRFVGFAAASAHSLMTWSLAASTIPKATNTSSWSSTYPSANCRPLSCAPAQRSMWHLVTSRTTAM